MVREPNSALNRQEFKAHFGVEDEVMDLGSLKRDAEGRDVLRIGGRGTKWNTINAADAANVAHSLRMVERLRGQGFDPSIADEDMPRGMGFNWAAPTGRPVGAGVLPHDLEQGETAARNLWLNANTTDPRDADRSFLDERVRARQGDVPWSVSLAQRDLIHREEPVWDEASSSYTDEMRQAPDFTQQKWVDVRDDIPATEVPRVVRQMLDQYGWRR